MRRPLSLIFAGLLFIHGAAIGSAETDDSYQHIAAQSGLLESARQMANQFGEGLEMGFIEAGAPSELAERVRLAAERSVSNLPVEATTLATLRSHLAKTDAEQISSWLKTATGKKATNTERVMLMPQAQQNALQQGQRLANKHRNSAREQLINRLDRAARVSENTVNMALHIQRTVLKAFFATLPDSEQPTDEQLNASVDANRFQLQGMINQQVYSTMLYTYESLSNAELSQYVLWLESDIGQRYSQANIQASRSTMHQVAERIGASTADTLRSWTTQSPNLAPTASQTP